MQSYRIMEWCEWKGALEIQFQPSCHGQEYLPQDQLVQSLIPLGLEQFQGWNILNFSGKTVPLPYHLTVKNVS